MQNNSPELIPRAVCLIITGGNYITCFTTFQIILGLPKV